MAQEWLVIYCLVDKAVSLARKYTMIGRSKSLENLRELRIIRLAAITYATYSRKRLRSKSTGLMSSAPVTELLISKDRVSVVMGGKTSKKGRLLFVKTEGEGVIFSHSLLHQLPNCYGYWYTETCFYSQSFTSCCHIPAQLCYCLIVTQTKSWLPLDTLKFMRRSVFIMH